MAEEGAPDDLAMLKNEIIVLKKTLAGLETAQDAKKICKEVLGTVKDAEASDGFLVVDGPPNKFHTSVGGSGGGGGCCVVA